MDSLLPIVALAVGLLACWLSGRSWAASRRLALEMIHLRARLLRLEDGSGPAAGGRRIADARELTAAGLGERLDLLEAELAAVRTRAAGPAATATASGGLAPDDLHARLLRAGYSSVVVLERRSDSAWLVEAERDGLLEKGWAHATPTGGVEVRGVSSLRAFP